MEKLKEKMEAFLGIDPDEEKVRMKHLVKADNFRNVINCWRESFPGSAVRDLAEKKMKEIVVRVSHAATLIRIGKEVPLESELANIVDNALNTVLPKFLEMHKDLEWVLREKRENYHLKKLRRHFEKRAVKLIREVDVSKTDVKYLLRIWNLAIPKTFSKKLLENAIEASLHKAEKFTLADIDDAVQIFEKFELAADASLKKVFENFFRDALDAVLQKIKDLSLLARWSKVLGFSEAISHKIASAMTELLSKTTDVKKLISLFNEAGDVSWVGVRIDDRIAELLKERLPKEKDLRKLIDLRMQGVLVVNNQWEGLIEKRMQELVDEIKPGGFPKWLPDLLDRKGIPNGDKIPFVEEALVSKVSTFYRSLFSVA